MTIITTIHVNWWLLIVTAVCVWDTVHTLVPLYTLWFHCTHSGSTVHTLVPLLLYFTLTLLWAITVFLSHFKRYWIYPELELSWCIHAETVDPRLRVSIWWQNNYKCITFCIALSKCTYTVVRTLHVHCICVCVCVLMEGETRLGCYLLFTSDDVQEEVQTTNQPFTCFTTCLQLI